MFRRTVALVAAALALSAPAAHAADSSVDPSRDPVTLARQRLDAVRTDATDLSGKISAAQTQQATLEAQIAETQQKVPELKARADQLRTQVKERAAQLYVRHGDQSPFETTMAAETTEDGLRAAHLTDAMGEHDNATAIELRDTAAKLAAQEAQLQQQRDALQQSIAALTPLNDQLQQKLQVATELYEKVQALVAGTDKQGADVDSGATACPVKGIAVFTDDFGELRSGGAHPGIDMGALTDTPVVAVSDGIWRRDVGGDGGNGAWLTGFDGNSYYYAHFDHYEPKTPEGLVLAGTVIGYVGMTGNATGPHLHFEIHPGAPGQNPPVDPFATLLALCDQNTAPPKSN